MRIKRWHVRHPPILKSSGQGRKKIKRVWELERCTYKTDNVNKNYFWIKSAFHSTIHVYLLHKLNIPNRHCMRVTPMYYTLYEEDDKYSNNRLI